MIVHLLDGTYELFRQFYGRRRFEKGENRPFDAVVGVLHSVLEILEQGATHIGVATDHVIESFRNALWSDYKTGDGIEPALLAQFHPLEDALAAMGVAVWPMIELEADDGLASAARTASADEGPESLHLVARQGPGAVRVRRPDRAGGPQGADGPQRRRYPRQVRGGARLDSRLPRPGGGRGRRLSGHPGDRPGHGGTAPEPTRRHRGLPTGRPRGPARPGVAVQRAGNAQDRRTAVQRCGGAEMARPHQRIRGMRGAPGRCSLAAALPNDP